MVYEQKHAIQKTMDVETRYINEEKYNELKRFNVRGGDIIVSCRGTIGETYLVPDDSPLGIMHPSIMKIRLKDRVYIKNYFNDLLYTRLKKYESEANGSGVKMAISAAKLGEELFPVPTIQQQKNIEQKLSSVRKLLRLRKEELLTLDQIIKARFVELFGNPIHNEKGWDTAAVETVCKEIFGGGTPSKSHPEYYENGDIPWVSSKDMKTDVLTESQIYINQKGIDNSTARMVPVNSVIMVIRSGILKHTLPVAINAVPITVNQDLKVFIPGESILTRFMAVQFKMQEADILSGVRAVTADNIEFNSLKQRAMIVPPIELQKEYVDFLEQVDKSKVAVQKALDETQLLFDSLMQEYFG
ncbi:MAG: restriction endonuclease subunit S [Lachnospiraceae bacterium]|nr:restriction endonuclease subunit S [Lachnospiraceae bacterium]